MLKTNELNASELLVGRLVRLRALEPGDLEFLYRWENTPEVWQYGDCDTHTDETAESVERNRPQPEERFSREVLGEFIYNQQHDLHATEQLRFVICCRDSASTAVGAPIGFIDLFDFDSKEFRAGVGILICDPAHRGKGYGGEALELILNYARRALNLRELWCNIAADNHASLALFSGANFVRTEAGNGFYGNKKLLTFVKSWRLSPLPA